MNDDKFLDRSEEFGSQLATLTLQGLEEGQDDMQMEEQGIMMEEVNDAEPVIRNMDLRLVGLRMFLTEHLLDHLRKSTFSKSFE